MLVLSHDCSRTGAPVALLRLLTWAAEGGHLAPEMVVGDRGPLFDAFAALGPVTVRPLAWRWRAETALRMARGDALADVAYRRWGRQLARRCQDRGISVVLVNTVIQLPIGPHLRAAGVGVACYVHELDHALERLAGPSARRRLRDAADVFLAASDHVAEMLTARLGVGTDRVVVAPGIVAAPEGPTDGHEHAFVVGAAGTPNWTKGSDLFAQLAGDLVGDGHPPGPYRFRWVGAPAGPASDLLRAQLQWSGAGEVADVEGVVPDLVPLIRQFSVFACTSREDAMPLTVLEAAACGVPATYFEGSGGLAALGRAGGAIGAPFGDVAAMAGVVARLHGDPDERRALGRRAREFVESHCRADVVGPAVVAALRSVA